MEALMELDALILSRIQFAATIAFHILFPSFTIGLANWLMVLEWRWLKTRDDTWRRLFDFWSKVFAVSFGMGVVSGVVMSYQFGTNWSGLTAAAGNILGPLLGYEVLTAFFLEAGFLGIMLFGWDRVGEKLHFTATCMVAIGTLISTFWIISANSWMQTPTGHDLVDGVFIPADWWAIIFNPSFPLRLAHMVTAAFLTTAFTIAGISAWYVWRGDIGTGARRTFAMAVLFAGLVAPVQIIIGDFHGLDVKEYQPAKLAAMEGHWDSDESPVPLRLFAIPDAEAEKNHFEIAIPYLGSLILDHSLDGKITGLKDFDAADRPPVGIVFWSFRIMVAAGLLMALVGLIGLFLMWRGRLATTRPYLAVCMAMTPIGFIAVLAGWVTTEVGRQPYVIYGLLRTADAVSPVSAGSVAFSLTAFMIVYTIVFGAGTWYILKLLRKGPVKAEAENAAYVREKGPVASLTEGGH
tara:strand:+ start:2231 stop:3625 length:1395 start_codon:yes stop_codon:yes gene_type:complete